MAKDERMTYVGVCREAGLRRALLIAVGLLAMGCSSAASTATPKGSITNTDAGPHKDSGSGDGGIGVGFPLDARDEEIDSGDGDAPTGATSQAATDAGRDAGAGPMASCVSLGERCSTSAGSPECCTDGCYNGVCGCIPEGSKLADGGAGTCCGNLAIVDGGYCGTSACVPDGTPCGGGAGVVCCNDDCNGTTCGGT